MHGIIMGLYGANYFVYPPEKNPKLPELQYRATQKAGSHAGLNCAGKLESVQLKCTVNLVLCSYLVQEI